MPTVRNSRVCPRVLADVLPAREEPVGQAVGELRRAADDELRRVADDRRLREVVDPARQVDAECRLDDVLQALGEHARRSIPDAREDRPDDVGVQRHVLAEVRDR